MYETFLTVLSSAFIAALWASFAYYSKQMTGAEFSAEKFGATIICGAFIGVYMALTGHLVTMENFDELMLQMGGMNVFLYYLIRIITKFYKERKEGVNGINS